MIIFTKAEVTEKCINIRDLRENFGNVEKMFGQGAVDHRIIESFWKAWGDLSSNR